MTEPDQIAALHARLSDRRFDILFVNAGTTNANPDETIAETSTEEFVRVMITNALSPMRVVEGLQDIVAPDGMIGVMSSGQGSVSNNTNGGREVYRGTKAALNQYMRSYAARHTGEPRALVLMAPGWIRTELGGPNAPFSMEENVPRLVDVLLARQGTPGLQYVDYLSRQLGRDQNAGQRESLQDLLLEEQRNLMLTNVDTPYAADILDPPTVSSRGPTMKILIALGVGFLISFLVVAGRVLLRSR